MWFCTRNSNTNTAINKLTKTNTNNPSNTYMHNTYDKRGEKERDLPTTLDTFPPRPCPPTNLLWLVRCFRVLKRNPGRIV